MSFAGYSGFVSRTGIDKENTSRMFHWAAESVIGRVSVFSNRGCSHNTVSQLNGAAFCRCTVFMRKSLRSWPDGVFG